MDQVSASETALQIPDLLATVLRCLGPLEWVKCASVCPDWCNAILSRGEATEAAGAAVAASTMAPTPAAAAASTMVEVEEGATMRSAGGRWGDNESAAAPAATSDLWREFALTLMAGNNEGIEVEEGNRSSSSSAEASNNRTVADEGGRSCNGSESGAFFSCFNPHAAGIATRGGRMPSSARARGCVYRNVCLEGDPAVLGPPLKATTARVGDSAGRGVVEVATVSLRDVTAASSARYRQRRVFIKFLSLWTRYGGPTIAAKVEVTQHDLRLTLNSPLGRKQASKRGCSAKAAAERAASRTSSSSSCKKRAGRPPKCCTAATAMLGDALSLFTRLLVLCRRCRRPCTALFAGEDSGPSRHRRGPSPDLRGSRTGRVVGGKTTTVVAPGSSRCRRGGVALWIECQGEGCGVTSWVGVAAANGGGGGGGTDPPPWLAKFSRFVLNRAWKDVNALAEDHGTEWFSDTSPAAVQSRQDEARARSVGLDALASRGSDSDGGDTSSDGD